MTKILYGPEPFTYPDNTPASGVEVHVYAAGTTTHAILYGNASGTISLPNPLNTDGGGLLAFYADPGFYDLSANGALFAIQLLAPGSAGGTATYEHTQSSSNSVWLVNHNLGTQFPDVDVFDEEGSEIFPQIDYASTTSLTITFPTARTGLVRVRA
jgi:hypothetical protein